MTGLTEANAQLAAREQDLEKRAALRAAQIAAEIRQPGSRPHHSRRRSPARPAAPQRRCCVEPPVPDRPLNQPIHFLNQPIAMSVPTLLDLAKLDAGVGYPIIEESVKSAPELRVVPASTILGTTMELTVRTGLPSVAFRDANQGVARSKSKYETRTFQTHILDHQIAVDEQIVNGAKDRGRLLENHVIGVMEAAMQYVGSQFYYGTGHDAKGFPGLLAQYAADTDHTVDAAGAANKTSVWFLKLGPECLEFLFGNGQTIGLQGRLGTGDRV